MKRIFLSALILGCFVAASLISAAQSFTPEGLYERGIDLIGQEKLREAEDTLTESAAQGCWKAYDALYDLYKAKGQEVKKVAASEQYMRHLRDEAKSLNPEALTLLGQCYLAGKYVDTDKTKGWDLILQAANSKYPPAITTIAYGFLSGGQGLPQSAENWAKWMKIAADLGDAEAQAEVGNAYDFGIEPFEVDKDKALAYYTLSAEGGNIEAYFLLGAKYQFELLDYAKAADCYEIYLDKITYKQGAPDAITLRSLGEIYRDGGNGIDPDTAVAIDYFERAAALGDEPSAEALKKIR